MTGLHLAHYQIEDELGRGGMGIVYRATDTKLNRQVALKVLPPAALAGDDDRARFFREAQAAAQLSHPNVCHVYQVDEAVLLGEDGKPAAGVEKRPFIAMEYISGVTLRERIEQGPLKIDEVVSIATQVAEALQAAHESNIVHRDVKAANVMLSVKGRVKVLDFGLAKTAASTKLTRMGSTMGTVAYMSPEQARSEEVDARSDLWSLGVVMYEMTAGRLPFASDYEQAAVYSILNEDPEPITALRSGVPLQFEWIVAKCLSKKPQARYQQASDLLVDLRASDRWTSGGLSSVAGETSGRSRGVTKPRKRLWLTAAVVGTLLTGAVLGYLARTVPVEHRPVRLYNLELTDAAPEAIPVLSPSGAYMAYRTTDDVIADVGGVIARPMGGAVSIRDMRTGRQMLVPGTAGALHYQFSPDDRRLLISLPLGLYVADLPLRLEDQTGPREPLLIQSGIYTMGSWGQDGSLYYEHEGGLWVLRPNAETPVILAAPDRENRRFITGLGVQVIDEFGKAMVTVGPRRIPRARIVAVSMDSVSVGTVDLQSGAIEDLGIRVVQARYIATGHLLFFQGAYGRQLVARPFDFEAGRFLGPSAPLWNTTDEGHNSFSVDRWGTLVRQVAAESGPFQNKVMILDSSGLTDLTPEGGNYGRARVSPDGSVVAVEDRSLADAFQIRTINVADGFVRPLTFEGSNVSPAWSADGSRVLYVAGPDQGQYEVRSIRSDGSGQPETHWTSPNFILWPDWSLDDRFLVFSAQGPTTGLDIWLYVLETGSAQVIDESPGDQRRPVLSPDGRYIAYRDEGRLIVRETLGTRSVVAAEGNAVDARWSADGTTIFSKNDDESVIYGLPVTTDPSFRVVGRQERLYDLGRYFEYDAFPDGRRFAAVPMSSASEQQSIEIISNWFEELRTRIPAER